MQYNFFEHKYFYFLLIRIHIIKLFKQYNKRTVVNYKNRRLGNIAGVYSDNKRFNKT